MKHAWKYLLFMGILIHLCFLTNFLVLHQFSHILYRIFLELKVTSSHMLYISESLLLNQTIFFLCLNCMESRRFGIWQKTSVASSCLSEVTFWNSLARFANALFNTVHDHFLVGKSLLALKSVSLQDQGFSCWPKFQLWFYFSIVIFSYVWGRLYALFLIRCCVLWRCKRFEWHYPCEPVSRGFDNKYKPTLNVIADWCSKDRWTLPKRLSKFHFLPRKASRRAFYMYIYLSLARSLNDLRFKNRAITEGKGPLLLTRKRGRKIKKRSEREREDEGRGVERWRPQRGHGISSRTPSAKITHRSTCHLPRNRVVRPPMTIIWKIEWSHAREVSSASAFQHL